MAVATDEMAGSPWLENNGGRLTLHRIVKIAWDDMFDFVEQLQKPSVNVGSSILNFAGEPFPGKEQYRVSGYKIRPLHGETVGALGLDEVGLPRHEFAVVDISYNLLPGVSLPAAGYDPVEMLSHTMTGGGKVYTVPNTGMKYQIGSGNLDYRDVPEALNLSIFIPTGQHECHWPMVPSPNWQALEALRGSCNNATFILRGFGYPKETLLYMGYTAKQSVKAIQYDEPLWDITLRFEAMSVPAADYATFGSPYGGHNHKFINDTEAGYFGFYKITTGPNGDPPNTPLIARLENFAPLYSAAISAAL